MEYNVFRDYCKAENSEDEEVNHDLQSQLYSEIYYASNDKENVDTKTNVKLETSSADDEKLHKNANTSRTSGSNDSFIKSSYSNNCTKTDLTNDLTDTSALTEKDDKPDIKTICVTSTTELLHKDINNKGNFNASCVKMLGHSEENCELSKVNKQSTMCYNVMEMENKDELKIMHCLDHEATVNEFSHLNSVKVSINSNDGKVQEVTATEININNNNIFKKYEFSKLFINKLYLEKYENLEKRLQKIGEEKEQEETNVEEDAENYQKQQPDKHMQSPNDIKASTKYNVCHKLDKMKKTANYSDEITVLSSDTESDSEESILEVPIPPKPQPPVINLQDSDESLEALCTDSDEDQECLFLKQKENILSGKRKKTSTVDQDSDNSTSILDFVNDTSMTEDIVLNCTEIQKSASSIKEILELSKTIQSEQSSKIFYDKSITKNKVPNKNLSNSNQLLLSTKNKDNISEFQLPSKTFSDSSVTYERDKSKKSVNFAEDVTVSNFVNVNELTPNRKRHHDNDSEPCTSVKQRKDTSNIESKCSKTSTEQYNVKDKNKQESWEEYFFRPMSANIKAFYNEPRGQENFDIQHVQSKMSKDPKLWTILHEDLMPNLLKHRYWNMKCSYCHKQGHQKHNCRESYKPIRCHMCGTQGHTDTRCPQKMCLTCGKKQGTFRKTCESCRMLYCNMCKAVGHKSTECPDLWRRFHQTTQTTEINIPENLSEVMKPADLLYCCNCTKRGHDSSTCNEYRWSQHFPTPAFVSNYTEGPEYEASVHKNTNEDVIPLSKSKKHKNMVFLKDNDGLESCFDLMIRIRSVVNFGKCILDFFIYWLKLKDEDKQLDMCVNLPRNTKKLMKSLKTKLDEIGQNVQDPKYLYSQIEQLKTSRTSGQDPKTLTSTSNKILDLQSKLMKVFHTKPKNSVILRKFRKSVNYLNRHPCDEIGIGHYLNIIVNYNKIFLPRTLTDSELQRFFKAYYNDKNKKNKKKDNGEIKKQKKNKGLTAYEIFTQNLRKFNNSRAAGKTRNNMECSDTSTNIEKQDKQIHSITPTVIENVSISSSVQSNMQTATHNTENISVETYNVENSVTESTNIYPIECTQLSRNRSVSSNNEEANTTTNLKSISSNLISIPLQEFVSTDTSSTQTKNDHLNSVSCTKVKPSEDNIEKHIETKSSNNEVVKSNEQEKNNAVESEASVAKRKKSKKAKKAKLDLESNLKATEIPVTNIITPAENKANEIINEALEFNLPYMNKAVEEVRKRINDKNLKQEHVDTLQRLINLEKDHRKYVSSFCNYLQ
ncbi:Zinc finger CCHC domain-containing protein 7 [Habropoda laboriosa]|uniref:Zinc finger CCHC domain-containing protein 7 n=1 Tax=Habropoda laboriosa TaxID=597456 RepID=A0A0L7QK44_9HYME|nr:Zinc finger CCHC domain-containing protein 7 [Habropoda laboriosa]